MNLQRDHTDFRVVSFYYFPNQEVQTQIAALADDALWNATDAQGNLIVDQNAHSKDEIAAIQNTSKRTMAVIVHKKTSTSANSNQRQYHRLL